MKIINKIKLKSYYPWTNNVLKLWKNWNKLDNLKELQLHAINIAMKGYSLIIQLPTGYGKSCTFQIPALLSKDDRTTIVISPLKSLIHDQIENLRNMGISAVDYSSSISYKDKNSVLNCFLKNDNKKTIPKLLYTTPESFVTLFTQNVLQESNNRNLLCNEQKRILVDRIVVDEAHCILSWGSSFRPSYIELCSIRRRFFNNTPVTLVTATANKSFIQDMIKLWDLDEQVNLMESKESYLSPNNETNFNRMVSIREYSDRQNLHIYVYSKPKKKMELYKRILPFLAEPTIIYALTKNQVEDIVENLQANHRIRAVAYHADLKDNKKKRIHNLWRSGAINVVVATTAFGMGVDRANVRNVIHYSLPFSLACYYQQIGRAGRDNKISKCILFYDYADAIMSNMIVKNDCVVNHSNKNTCNDKLFGEVSKLSNDVLDMVKFCETTECRRTILFNEFGSNSSVETPCNRSCNCGVLLVEGPETAQEKTSTTKWRTPERVDHSVNLLYCKILTEGKRIASRKREIYTKSKFSLSRKLIRDILKIMPKSIDELAEIKGIGHEKASHFFYLLRDGYKDSDR